MTHDIEAVVREYAEIKGLTPEDAFAEMNIRSWGNWWEAHNRGQESHAYRVLAELKEDIRQEKIRQERLNGYRWVKEFDSWVVAGDFGDKKIGDDVIVTEASGERQEKRIVEFTPKGNAKVL